jgi:hypothetical protein
LKIAYPDGPSTAVKDLLKRIGNWEGDIYQNPAFARNAPDQPVFYYLRLGNGKYPHMKLRIESWPQGSEFFFRADTHDRHIVVSRENPDYQAFSELSKNNQKLAELIEGEWQRAGLPTFAGRLADEIARRRNAPP